MSLRIASLRRLRPLSSRSLAPTTSARFYATPSPSAPRPSRNSPAPAGLEGLFGSPKPSTSAGGSTVAPKPAGSEPPSGPSTPKTPNVDLPKPTRPPSQEENDAAEEADDADRKKKKLSDSLGGSAGKRVGFGGGGGGGGGGSGGGSGGPGGDPGFRLNTNTLILGVAA